MRVISVEGVRGSALRSAVRSIYAREVGARACDMCFMWDATACGAVVLGIAGSVVPVDGCCSLGTGGPQLAQH